MNHDTDQLSALVDGELDHETRDQLLGHLAHCAECRQVVDTERRLKSMLQGLTDPRPNEPLVPGLASRMGGTLPGPSVDQTPASARPPQRFAAGLLAPGPVVATDPNTDAAVSSSGRSRRARYAVGLFSVTGAVFSVAFAVGGESSESEAPRVTPPVQQYSFEHTEMSRGVPVSDPAGVTASFGDNALVSPAGR